MEAVEELLLDGAPWRRRQGPLAGGDGSRSGEGPGGGDARWRTLATAVADLEAAAAPYVRRPTGSVGGHGDRRCPLFLYNQGHKGHLHWWVPLVRAL